MATSDHDTQARIAELEETVEQLRDRVERLEGSETADHGSLYDRYDEYVLGRVSDPCQTSPRKLMRLYEEAGVRDRGKRKRRAKRLRRLEAENEG